MLTSVLAFVFVLGVLIFVHELGHYLVARRIGVRVLTFSLGFGPKLLNIRRGDTDYCVSAIPLGGYVKMAGETAEDERTGAPDEFLSKSKWQRFQVLVAGPVMNILLAIVVLAVVLYQGADVPAYEQRTPIVGRVVEGSAAARAGSETGDRIVSIADKTVETWEQVFMAVLPKANREVRMVVRRDGLDRTLLVTPDAQTKYEIGDIGVLPEIHPQVISVSPGDPAAEAGVQIGDVVLGVDDRMGVNRAELIEYIQQHDGAPITLHLDRAGGRVDLTLTPRLRGDVSIIGAILSIYEVRTIEPGPLQAIQLSLERNWEWSRLIVQTLVGLFTRETSVKQLMGPVAIAEMSGGAAELGWLALFNLMALISLNLGLLNLMPIPVLDGGHITILALEGLARRDFSMRVKEKLLIGGFVLLLMLMVTVIYNDLTRVQWIEHLMFWR
ncbi:MAG: RIP metalloprotease RseP [Planctomycetota bacterium]